MIYDFASEVQDDILKLMIKDAVFSSASYHWVKGEYFEGRGRQWLSRLFLFFYEKYGMSPTAGQVATEAVHAFKRGEIDSTLAAEVGGLIRSVYRTPLSGSRDYTLDVVRKFARHRAWENAIISAHPYLQQGNYDKVDEIMMAAQNVAVDLDVGGYWYFETRKERVRRRQEGDDKPVLPFGIPEIDFHLRRGGVREGEVALLMAPKGSGKCLIGNTVIATKEGLQRIDSFVGTDKPGWHNLITPKIVYDAEGKEAIVFRVYCDGEGPTRKLTLRNGIQIEGTPEHPLLVCCNGTWEWREISLIREGDFVAEFIGSLNAFVKNEDLLEFNNIPSGQDNLENLLKWRPIRVDKIEESFGVTYDIEVPDSHSFIANGIVSHNSIGLSHVARRAIFEGWNVAYYSFEMGDEQNADRLDSGFTGVDMWNIDQRGGEVLDILDELANAFPHSLMIKQYPTKGRTIADIRRHLDTLRRLHGWEPKLIVLDYITIVKPSRFLDGRHAEIQETLEDFRGLCVELNCVGWTAAQVNRSGAKKRTADGTDAAGSWDQLATADYVFILAQEPHEKLKNEIRIYIDKCRDGRSNVEIGPLVTDWAKMCFIRRSNKTIMEIKEDWDNREFLAEEQEVARKHV